MTDKVHGGVENGYTFSADVAFVTVASATILEADGNEGQFTEASVIAHAANPATPLEANLLPGTISILQQISTVVGTHIVDGSVSIIADYAQGFVDMAAKKAAGDATAQDALEAELTAHLGAAATIAVGTGFAAV